MADKQCKLARMIEMLPEEEAQGIQLDLASNTSNVSIGRTLCIPDITVSRHRRRLCACYSPGHVSDEETARSRQHDAPEFDKLVREIAAEFLRQGMTVNDLGAVDTLKVTEGTYQMLYKNAEDEGVVVDLEKSSVTFVMSPSWATGPKWETVDQVPAPKITYRRATPTDPEGIQTAVIFPDPQVGFRLLETDEDGQFELDAFHDDSAINVAMQIAAYVKPDVIANLGDGLDLPQFSKYPQDPNFARTVQPSLNRYHMMLAEQRAILGKPQAGVQDLVVLEGNHDRRLENFIKERAAAAYGIRVANIPESWPVMSLPNLLRFEELGVHYVGGFPAGSHFLNDNLELLHGRKVRSSGSTAAAYDERHSVIFGHVQRRERHDRTKRDRFGSYTTTAISAGCLCKVDGTVPSVKGSTDPLGRPVASPEDWQQAVVVVRYETGNGRFWADIVDIEDGVACYGGKFFHAE